MQEITQTAVNSTILDLRSFTSLSEIEKVVKLSPDLIGYYCVGPSLFLNHSVNAISVFKRSRSIRIMLDLNVMSGPEVMFHLGEQLKSSGFSIISIPCTQGNRPAKAFMEGIGVGVMDKRGKNREKMDRPLVFGVGISPDLDSSEVTVIHGRKHINFLDYTIRTNLDGVVCTEKTLSYFCQPEYDNVYKLCMNTTLENVGEAIKKGADFVTLTEPRYHDYSPTDREEVRLFFLNKISENLISRRKGKNAPIPEIKKEPEIPVKTPISV